jgi:hypothetical protein
MRKKDVTLRKCTPDLIRQHRSVGKLVNRTIDLSIDAFLRGDMQAIEKHKPALRTLTVIVVALETDGSA